MPQPVDPSARPSLQARLTASSETAEQMGRTAIVHRAALESTLRYYRCRRRDIAFLRFAVEACDGLAFLRTLDPAGALVALHVPPGCEDEVDELMRGLQKVVRIEERLASESSPAEGCAVRT